METGCLELLYIYNLIEAHSNVLNEQQSHFRAASVAIIQYDAGHFNLKVFVNCTLYSAVKRDIRVESSCVVLNYCYDLLFGCLLPAAGLLLRGAAHCLFYVLVVWHLNLILAQ